MKEVFIIVRPDKFYKTKDVLSENNFFALSSKEVLGRGRNGVDFKAVDGSDSSTKAEHPLVAKKMIEIVCRDEDLDQLVKVVLDANQTGHPGDGKIFVIDVEDCIRIRTSEEGVNAIM